MTVRDLRECLYEVTVQDQEISEDNVVELMMLWTKRLVLGKKIEMLSADYLGNIQKISELKDERCAIVEQVINYECK